MKPHPRIRKTIKWGGAALTVLLVVVWIGSGFISANWLITSRHGVGINAGMFSVVECTVDLPRSLNIERRSSFGLRWWKWTHNSGMLQQVFLPLWIPVTASLLITGAAWRLDTLARRRARMNLCVKCHYDRTGLAGDAVCPECGKPPPSA